MRANKLAIIAFGMSFPNHDLLRLDEHTLVLSVEDLDLVKKLDPALQLFNCGALRNHVYALVTSARVQHHPFSPIHQPHYRDLISKAVDNNPIVEVITYENLQSELLAWLRDFCSARGITLNLSRSPGYINSSQELEDANFDDEYNLQSFYLDQRKKHRILLDDMGEPIETEIDSVIEKKYEVNLDNFTITHTNYTLDLADTLEGFDPYFKEVFLKLELATSRHEALRHSEHILRSFPQSGNNNHILLAAIEGKFAPINHYLESGLVLPMEIVQKAVVYKRRYQLSFKPVEQLVKHILGWREFTRFQSRPTGFRSRNMRIERRT